MMISQSKKSGVSTKLIIISELHHILRPLKSHLILLSSAMELRQEDLKLSEQIEPLLDGLMDTLPDIWGISYDSCSYGKITLNQCLLAAVQSRKNFTYQLLPELNLPIGLESVSVWERYDYELGASEELFLHTYWQEVFRHMDRWKRLSGATLEKFAWQIEQEHVYFYISWQGSFRSIQYFSIPGIDKDLWAVTFASEYSETMARHSTASLLVQQINVDALGNKFLPVSINDKVLTLKLEIVRADEKSTFPPKPNLPETTFDHVANYIIRQAGPAYLNISQKLEKLLNSEIRRWELYVQAGELDSKYLENLQRLTMELITSKEMFSEIVDD